MNTAPPISRNGRHSAPRLVDGTFAVNRNGARIAIGTILVVVTTLVAIVVFGRIGSRYSVLAVARPVEMGQPIALADLAEVRVSTDPGLRPIAASERAGVVGRVAAVALVPGTLITRAQLGDGPGLAPGSALVGAVLKPGQVPIGTRAGHHVLAVIAPSPGAGTGTETGSPAPSAQATVAAVENLPDGGTLNVSLAVSAASAPALAIAAASGRLSIVVIGR